MLPERLDSVLHVLYLTFNEGYSATTGATLVRRELASEAIRLARVLAQLMPAEPEVLGLLALLLLQDSRRDARQAESGELVVLAEQDRSRWDRGRINEGLTVLDQAALLAAPGPHQVQAAIAATHAQADSADATDWPHIVLLYDRLLALVPSPVVALNRAVAVAQTEGPIPALAIIDALAADGTLDEYHLLHAARGELLRRLRRSAEAAEAYARARDLATNDVERAYLDRRRREVAAAGR